MNTHFKIRASSVLLHSLTSFLPSQRINNPFNGVHLTLPHFLRSSMMSGSLPRSLPWWQADPKMASMAPASWYLLLCVISFPWVKTGPNDLLLFWREHSNHDGVSPSGLGCRKILAAILLIFFMPFLLLARYHAFSCCGKVYKTGQKWSKNLRETFNPMSPRTCLKIVPLPTKPWGDLKSCRHLDWNPGRNLSQRKDPAKPHLDFWPTKIVRWILF